MKASLKIVSITATAQAYPQLFGLPRADKLSTESELTPFESIAHIETFDPIPVFGGQELRQKMLNQQNKVVESVAVEEDNRVSSAARDIHRGFKTVTKTVGCSINALASSGLSAAFGNAASGKLGYGRFCGDNDEVVQSQSQQSASSSSSAREVERTNNYTKPAATTQPVNNAEDSAAEQATASVAVAVAAAALYLQ